MKSDVKYICEWWEERPGHGGDECEDHLLEDCYETKQRAFPTVSLAEAFAKRQGQAAFGVCYVFACWVKQRPYAVFNGPRTEIEVEVTA